MATPPNTPTDMRDLLIRLDEKCQNGFASIMSRLDAMDRRADNHEDEIQTLKMDLLELRTTLKTMKWLIGAAWGAGVAVAAIVASVVF